MYYKKFLAIVCFIVLMIVTPAMLKLIQVSSNKENLNSRSLFFVSESGNDNTGDGTIESPFHSILKAKETVKAIIAGGMTENITVYVRGGEYYLDQTILFDESDSGRDGHTVTYAAYPNEVPTFFGGQKISNWEYYSDKIYKASIEKNWTFNILTEGLQMGVKARYPNEGYLFVEDIVNVNPNNQFQYKASDLQSIEKPEDLEVYMWPGGPEGIYNWYAMFMPVTSLDKISRIITVAESTPYEMGGGSRYYFQGKLEMLDQPGEFYVDDNEGILYYFPFNTNIENLEVVAPKVLKIFEFHGSTPEKPVSNIIIDGLQFSTTDMSYDQNWIGDGVIYLTNADGIVIKNTEIINAGSCGILLDFYAQNILINNNLIHKIGKTGVQIRGNNLSRIDKTIYNTVDNNHIYEVGIKVGHGSGIEIIGAAYNTISHNRIHDTSRYAIDIKGTPMVDYLIGQIIDGIKVTEDNVIDFMRAHDNIIEFNDLSNANLDSQDTSVIESWGGGPNNLIRNNLIHDSNIPFSFGTGGIYLDDECYKYIVENNIIYNIQTEQSEGEVNQAIYIKGKFNQVMNNIVANSFVKSAFSTDDDVTNEESGIIVERNILYDTNDIYYLQGWSDTRIKSSENNLYFNNSGTYNITWDGYVKGPANSMEIFKTIQNGKYDQFTKNEDPLFMDVINNDLRLQYNSPAYQLGFKDIDIQNMGLKADYPFSNQKEDISTIYVKEVNSKTDSGTIELKTNESKNLTVLARTLSGFVDEMKNVQVYYESNDTTIVKVDSLGKLTGISKGVAIITVTIEKNDKILSKELFVLVDDQVVDLSIVVSKQTMIPEDTSKFSIIATTELGRRINYNDQTSFSVSDNSIVEIEDGILIAKAIGSTNLIAKLELEGITKQIELKLNVKENILDGSK